MFNFTNILCKNTIGQRCLLPTTQYLHLKILLDIYKLTQYQYTPIKTVSSLPINYGVSLQY